MEDKKSKIITIVIVVAIIILIVALIIVGIKLLKPKDEDIIAETNDEVTVIKGNDNAVESNTVESLNAIDFSTGKKDKELLEGYEVIGQIEIPKTELNAKILGEVSKRSLEIAVAQIFTTTKGDNSLNQPGNTVIYGHNYKNSLFFSRNNELQLGDEIYITDYTGEKKKYVIYDKFETTSNDTSFYTRNTSGIPEITLSTCTDDANTSSNRLIILAKAE